MSANIAKEKRRFVANECSFRGLRRYPRKTR
jgi:hypothetical protein